jgi:Asp-tRNA(Asn)/Glu-tRNA(Gln) amidotransferase A subunit family amidase
VPVGLKDIIDTADMPTENGSALHAGRAPTRDAAVVERLRAAGAVLLRQDGDHRVRGARAGQDPKTR